MAARKRPASEGASTCSKKDCNGIIHDEDARVEVAVSLRGEPAHADSRITWQDGAPMAFHRSCWDSLLQKRASLPRDDLQRLQLAAATAEYFDSAQELRQKAQEAASLLRQSSRAICFTGAGLSTAAGLGDYRGKRGKWTLEGQGVSEAYTTVYEELRPTFGHEAVAKLVEMGKIRYVISQNADGLHHLSGIPYTKLSDVHGSAFTEYCPSCGKRYVRQEYAPEDRAEDFFAGRLPGPMPSHIKVCRGCGSNHWTGRSCEDCGQPLHDTVISFGDGLEECVLRPAFEHAAEADACLSLGSTMSIGPSNQVVLIQKGPLIVCVRQEGCAHTEIAMSFYTISWWTCWAKNMLNGRLPWIRRRRPTMRSGLLLVKSVGTFL
ncbi:SRT1 [Symbiodinium natans]|uniref:Regulatory protein SIR2 homolog 7 n=1 Tax=Symbiodinium natans TaxID=878477 RepID=A0A812U347_9DINO|nr:SRT1 [Symbiodinium natans]